MLTENLLAIIILIQPFLIYQNEVNRYITWPGQALSYKTGEIQFTQFRSEAEKALGDKFDIRSFHDVLLKNVGPMTLVGKAVDKWVQMVLNE